MPAAAEDVPVNQAGRTKHADYGNDRGRHGWQRRQRRRPRRRPRLPQNRPPALTRQKRRLPKPRPSRSRPPCQQRQAQSPWLRLRLEWLPSLQRERQRQNAHHQGRIAKGFASVEAGTWPGQEIAERAHGTCRGTSGKAVAEELSEKRSGRDRYPARHFHRRLPRGCLQAIFRAAGLHLHGQVDQLSPNSSGNRPPSAPICNRRAWHKGARVALMMPNVLQYPVAMMGILRAGYTVVNVNPLYTPRELEHQLKDSGARGDRHPRKFCRTRCRR